MAAAMNPGHDVVAGEQDEVGPGGVGQRDDAADLRFVDEARAAMEIGDDGDAQALEGGAARTVEFDRMFDDAQAGGLDPEGVEAEGDEQAEQEYEDGRRGRPGARAPQNLIRARLRSDTALVPYWPA
ncbi:MAG: hypothetical protein WDM81_16940 [Rhizomicrobium sp.]